MVVRSGREWLRWIYKTWDGFYHREDRKRFYGEPPREFPCFCVAVVASFRYEEEQPRYIYRDELAGMFPGKD